jgi:myo-inositol-1(or 4)-monophosphatase
MAPGTDLDALLRVADRAAGAAAEVVLAMAGAAEGSGGPAAEAKGTGDYVTAVDRAAEERIREALEAGAPGIPVLGEEGGGPDSAPEAWVVDPVDGTTNLVHGFPAVGVSIALVRDGRPVVGVVGAPFLGETYLARRGGGGLRRDRAGREHPLRVSARPTATAVVTTGLPFRRRERLPEAFETFTRVFEAVEDIRRPGAAALDLCWVAAGVFDGYFERGLAAWDVAAGGLLVEEAGGTVTDYVGGPDYLVGDVLAAPPQVHADLLRVIARA